MLLLVGGDVEVPRTLKWGAPSQKTDDLDACQPYHMINTLDGAWIDPSPCWPCGYHAEGVHMPCNNPEENESACFQHVGSLSLIHI